MNRQRNIILLTCTLCLFSATVYSQISQVGPAEFQEQREEKGKQFVLNGAGLKTFLTIKVLCVGLYLQKDETAKDVLSDIPKSIEIVYLQNIPKSELVRATIKGIKKNTTKEEYKRLEPRIDENLSFYRNVSPQDRITVTYVPGIGTTVYVNRKKMGTIPGADYAKAFYAVWVGEKPVDKKMKLILLGQSKDTVT